MNDEIRSSLRARLEASGREGMRRRVEPRRGLDLTTNDYLGLARDPRLAEAMAAAAREHGSGAGAARLLGGDSPAHRLAEERAAAWLGAEAALLLPTGSQANAALLTALAGPGDVLLSDERNHASLVDGARLSKARAVVYRHRDVNDLTRLLRLHRDARRLWIATDSVFSITGEAAPLAEIVEAAVAHGAGVLVDEAHAAGVRGPRGAGLAAELGLTSHVAARVVTGGKALGVAGAFVVGDREVVDCVVNYGRAFLFTTAPPPGVAAALAEAIRLAQDMDGARARLAALTAAFRGALADAGVASRTGGPIVFVPIGAASEASAAAEALQAVGLDIRAVRPPTVPAGESGLRIVLHADLDEAALAEAAREVVKVLTRRRPSPAPAEPGTRALAVVGTDTGVGKTVVSAMLLLEASKGGGAAYWKPVQSGTGLDDDTAVLRRLAGGVPGVRIHPPAYAFEEAVAPGQAAERAHVKIERARLEALAAAHLTGGAFTIVETAGGLLVPFDEGFSQDGFLSSLRLPAVLVARTALGTLNHTRLTLEALAARRIPVVGLVLYGETHAENARDLARYVPGDRIVHVKPPREFDAAGLLAASGEAGLGRLLDGTPPWKGILTTGGSAP